MQTFPIKFDTNCFVRIVYEENWNSTVFNPSQLSFPIATNTSSDITISYMIHGLSNFGFAFDAEDIYINDEITILDGYFPFVSKYYKACDAFILLTYTFNSTATAIKESGYGNSDHATFLVFVECCKSSLMENNIMAGFISDFSSLETTSFNAIYSNLAFVTFPEFDTKSKSIGIANIYAYCYYCPKHLHQIQLKFEQTSLTISEIHSECQHLNNNGWNRKAFLLVSGSSTSYDALITNIDQKIAKGRKNFTQHLNETYAAEYFLFRLVSDHMNMSIDPNFREFIADEESHTHWYFNIKKINTVIPRFRNDIAATRGSYIVTHQDTGKLIYCMETSELVKIKWDIYLRVYDLQSWICILCVILAYSFIYKSVSKGFDLAWIFLDMEFWRRHSRKILAPYILGAMFIHLAYDSGMSTDFIDFEFPVYFREMFVREHKVWHIDISPVVEDVKQGLSLIPESFQRFLEQNSGKRDIEKGFYVEKGYYLPENIHDRVKALANKKLLLLNGVGNSFTFPSLFMTLAAMKKAVIEEKFICGLLLQNPSTNLQLTNSFLLRGYMSTKFTNLLEKLLEAGLLHYVQGLMTLQSAMKLRLKVDDISAVLSSSILGVRTPLGVVCAAYIALNFVFLFVFIVSISYKYRGNVSGKIRDLYKLAQKLGRNKVQIINQEGSID
ncbi:unnamed protein product [Orchesella dallaii]|uniref:Uncharacterized protein n=1 Tax=Orchesella dallaii TaxID=48710 RepID=A0ABP1R754_9HEXA